jgi:HEPN superfamily RiboL-PSP-like protein
MASARFLQLSRRAKKLRQIFLPKNFSPTGAYTSRQLDLARAYRLLVHAEIESYLEDRSKDLAVRATRQFKSDRRPRKVVLNLLSFHSRGKAIDESKMLSLYASGAEHVDDSLDSAAAAYHYSVQQNHGVKQTDLMKLLLPLGFQPSGLDALFIATLDSFGTNRGEVAHTSIKTQQQIDPKTELDTVSLLLKHLENIDSGFDLI